MDEGVRTRHCVSMRTPDSSDWGNRYPHQPSLVDASQGPPAPPTHSLPRRHSRPPSPLRPLTRLTPRVGPPGHPDGHPVGLRPTLSVSGPTSSLDSRNLGHMFHGLGPDASPLCGPLPRVTTPAPPPSTGWSQTPELESSDGRVRDLNPADSFNDPLDLPTHRGRPAPIAEVPGACTQGVRQDSYRATSPEPPDTPPGPRRLDPSPGRLART